MTPILPPWDGPGTTGLPEWALKLTGTCADRYTFSTMQVYDGRAVVAVKTGEGTGPLLVITRSEDEMLTALGLQPPEPSP